jgi:hypothetical protein
MQEAREAYPTVRDLIAKLSQLDPDARVGVRASCCSHTHAIHDVRASSDKDDDFPDVVIDGTE